MSPSKITNEGKPVVVIIGSGWAGFELAHHLDDNLYSVVVISPRRNTTYTPLLASAATGLFNFSLAEEPIRSRFRPNLHFVKASVTDIDFKSKTCTCTPAFEGDEAGEDEGLNDKEFTITYDIVVICPGVRPNDFGTPGVAEHGIFMTNVSDAMKIRKKLFDLLEKASLPTVTAERAKELLHIAIVGGGPTGIELCAELDDLCKKEIASMYPEVSPYIRISIYDVAPSILPIYDAKLHEYATAQLKKRDINVSPNTKIESVDGKALNIKDTGRVPYGMLLWVTGNKNVALLDNLEDDVRFPSKGPKRILTDSWLRVYKSHSGGPKTRSKSKSSSDNDHDDEVHDSVYALGDAADIESASLPTTAEVALQKAKYLRKLLNSQSTSMTSTNPPGPFKYTQKNLVSYIGGQDGVVSSGKGTQNDWTGSKAWLAWRGGNVMWARTWKGRIAILFAWLLNWLFGRELAKL